MPLPAGGDYRENLARRPYVDPCLLTATVALPAVGFTPRDVSARMPHESELLRSPALARSIDFSAQDEPLENLLERLGRKLGVRLTAAQNIRDLKLTLFYSRATGGAILREIAVYGDLRWVGQRGGYLLSRSPQAAVRVSRELALSWERARARVLGLLAAKCLNGEADGSSPLGRVDGDGAEGGVSRIDSDLSTHHVSIGMAPVHRPLHRQVAQFLEVLTPQQLDRVIGGTPMVVDGRHPVLLGAMRRIWTPELSPGPSDDPALKSPIRNEVWSGWIGSLRDQRSVNPMDFGRPVRREPVLKLRVHRELTHENGKRSSWAAVWDSPSPVTLSGGPSQVSSTEPIRLSGEATRSGTPVPSEDRRSLPLSHYLKQLFPQTHRQVIAPSFVRLRLTVRDAARTQTLGEFLELLEKRLELSATLTSTQLLLRSRTESLDLAEELPYRRLKPLMQGKMKSERAYLDALARLVCALTDRQIQELDVRWRDYLGTSPSWTPLSHGGIYESRGSLRLWASLGARQKRDLLAGRTLRHTEMSQRQRALWLKAAVTPELHDWGVESVLVSTVSPRAFGLRLARFEVKYADFVDRTGERRYGNWIRDEPGLLQSARPGSRVTHIPLTVAGFFYLTPTTKDHDIVSRDDLTLPAPGLRLLEQTLSASNYRVQPRRRSRR